MKIRMILSLFLAAGLLLAGCSELAPAATSEPVSQSQADTPSLISATGKLVPLQWASLSPAAAGVIQEVLVSEGESVVAGQTLLRLGGAASAQAALQAAAEQALLAQQALERLERDYPLRQAEAAQALAVAQLDLLEAERLWQTEFDTQKYDDALDDDREAVRKAKDDLDLAEEDFEPYQDMSSDNATRKDREQKLKEARRDHADAVRSLDTALARREAAEQAVNAAQARLQDAELDLKALADGPDPAEMAAARQRMQSARAQRAAAEQSLADLELVAPFAGVVTRLNVRPGEYAAPGQALLVLADLSALQVETTDLNEIDAARIAPGSSASLTFDALPDQRSSGSVLRIAEQPSSGSGVNYTAVIEAGSLPEGARWGMTVFVDIEVSR